MKLSKRNLLIVVLHKNGETLQNIGDITGLTRQGVLHVLNTTYNKHTPSEIDLAIQKEIKLKPKP